MSTIIKMSSVFVLSILLSGCTEDKSAIGSSVGFKQSQFSYQGTAQRNLGLEFIVQGRTERTITAIVTLPQYLDFKNQKIKFRWQLDGDIQVVSGKLAGEIPIITNDKKLKILLQVNHFSADSKKFIRFEASSEINKNRFFIDGIISSQSESSFENFVQGIENYKKREHLND